MYRPIDHPQADPMPIAHVFGPTYSGIEHKINDHHTPSLNPFWPIHFKETQEGQEFWS